MASLNEFKSYVRGGIAKPSHFMVAINLPPALSKAEPFSSNMNKINLFCDQTQLPGVSYGTSQVRSFGEFREVPYEKLFEQVTLSFYVDAGLKVKNLFDKWIEVIQDPVTRTFSYPDQYMTDSIPIVVYDSLENARYKVILNRCYPKSVSPIQLDYSAKDVMKLNVSFVYQFFTSHILAANSEPTDEIAQSRISEVKYGYSSEIPYDYFNNFDEFQFNTNSYDFTFGGVDSAMVSIENLGETIGLGEVYSGDGRG